MGKLWRIQPHDATQVARLEKAAGIPSVVAQLLVGRGVLRVDRAMEFIEAKMNGLRDPEELPGLTSAADLLADAIRGGRRIAIYGDYDADGMTSTSILVRCLRILEADVTFFVPNRLSDGYGLNHGALEKLASEGVQVVVTVDCGIASLDEADTAKRLGLDLIVTDHHEMKDRLPDAAGIVHPNLPGTNYPFTGLCGAGVAFKLAWGLCQRMCGAKKVTPQLRQFLLTAVGLAAIGTVADVVPLLDENRLIVRHGLRSLREQPTAGLKALMEVTKLSERSSLTSEDIAFMVAPRLNAAGRLGQAGLAVELMLTDDPSRAKWLAEYLHELNGNRDTLDRSIYIAAAKQVKEQFDAENDAGLVLAGRGWHAGVIGIVAGRIAERFNRPTVIISLDKSNATLGTGSARSACGVALHEVLAECGEHLVGHGGHAAAAGLRIEPDKVEAFRAAFCERVAARVNVQEAVSEVLIDAEAPFSQLTTRVVNQIEMLAPFGQGNPRPTLCATDVRLDGPPTKMGSGERHLSLRLKHQRTTLRAVAFGKSEWAEELEKIESLDVAFRPVINDFRGFKKVELHLVDWKPSEKKQ
jgi:single-stranded-DNA-specific exonuclease